MANAAVILSVVFLLAIFIALFLFIASAFGSKNQRRSAGTRGSAFKISIGSTGGKILGIILLVMLLLVAGVIVMIPGLYYFGAQEVTFCGDDWKDSVGIISNGSWNTTTDLDGNCALAGSGTISFDTEIFSRIVIIPAEKSPTDFEFKVGNFYTAGSKLTGEQCAASPKPLTFYAPYFYYSYDSKTNRVDSENINCVQYFDTAQKITLSRSWDWPERKLQLSIGDTLLAPMGLGEGKHGPTTGLTTFYSSQISIAKIKIYCDEPCRWEKIKPW